MVEKHKSGETRVRGITSVREKLTGRSRTESMHQPSIPAVEEIKTVKGK